VEGEEEPAAVGGTSTTKGEAGSEDSWDDED